MRRLLRYDDRREAIAEGAETVQITETWSITYERIDAFFSGLEDVRAEEDGRYLFGRCEICLTPLPPRPMGRFQFPQTRVAFDGPEEETAAIHRRFVLQFISAGG